MSAQTNPRKDVLIADSLHFYRRMLVELMTGQGYRVTEAENAEQALAHLETERPDLVLMDIDLPPHGGAGFLEAAAEAGHAFLKIVAIAPTAYEEAEWQQFRTVSDAPCVTRSAPIDDILVAARSVLFPEAKDLRRTPRAQAHIPISYRTETDLGDLEPEVATYSFNLSADGMFIVTSLQEPSPPGTKVHLRFWVPGAEDIIRTEGVTIWCNRAGTRMNELYPPGMGVMFLGFDGLSAAVVDEYVRARAAHPML